MPHALPEPLIRLQIATHDTDTLVRQVLVHGERREALGEIPTEDPATIVMPDGVDIRSVLALDALEHVLDEEDWLVQVAAALPAGGRLLVRAPLEGPLAWMDALNIYRYTQDITGWGERLRETQTKGWHRHYTRQDVTSLLEDAGFRVERVVRHGSPLQDVVHFGQLLWGKLLRRDDGAEFAARARRDEADAGFDLPRFGRFSTKLSVWATRLD